MPQATPGRQPDDGTQPFQTQSYSNTRKLDDSIEWIDVAGTGRSGRTHLTTLLENLVIPNVTGISGSSWSHGSVKSSGKSKSYRWNLSDAAMLFVLVVSAAVIGNLLPRMLPAGGARTSPQTASASGEVGGTPSLGANNVGSAAAAAFQSYANAARAFGADEPDGYPGAQHNEMSSPMQSAFVGVQLPQTVTVGVYMYDLNDPRYFRQR